MSICPIAMRQIAPAHVDVMMDEPQMPDRTRNQYTNTIAGRHRR